MDGWTDGRMDGWVDGRCNTSAYRIDDRFPNALWPKASRRSQETWLPSHIGEGMMLQWST